VGDREVLLVACDVREGDAGIFDEEERPCFPSWCLRDLFVVVNGFAE